ncbi:MAG: hypothetical protein HY735_13065 [Verrucomicrobia bacterium]|nr:hypothetical protein [Verrucomicrobiota bacterium]
MTNDTQPYLVILSRRANRCQFYSLHVLLQLIVEKSDRDSLTEFHDRRTIFEYLDGARLLFADYVAKLCEAATVRFGGTVGQEAYDLTIDKFSRLPEAGKDGIDCRNYFQAALTLLLKQPVSSELQKEKILGGLVQRLVYRHFELSLKERQRNSAMTRYEWQLPEGSLTVLMPRTLTGKERKEWLHSNVADRDPRRPGEKERVQMIIDESFRQTEVVCEEVSTEMVLRESDLPWFASNSLQVHGLAETVATEKVDRILDQRPAIQELGPSKLRALVLRIFEDICHGDYHDGELAREFGLSKATFSRFAGSQWDQTIPDLWRNLAAQILARDEGFAEVARELGLWKRVRQVAGARRGAQ